jgi:hypothetical protein
LGTAQYFLWGTFLDLMWSRVIARLLAGHREGGSRART